jgi:integrase
MPKLSFTTKTIESIKPTPGHRVEYWDEATRNFGLRVTERGQKTWFLMYVFNHRKKRLSLGVFPDIGLSEARLRAKKAQQRIDIDGIDPNEQRKQQRRADTFGDLVEQYLDLHAKVKKKSWKEDQRILNRYFLLRWRHYKANTITRKEVIGVLDEILERGAPIQSNRALAVVRKMFNWGIQRDIVHVNPCHQIPNPASESKRDRVLSDEEIRAIWKVLEKEPLKNAAYIKLLLLTAQRPGEVSKMKWSQVDLFTGWWTLPAESVKNNLQHRVPLSPQVIEILRHLQKESDGSDWVFKSRGRNLPIYDYKKCLSRIKNESAISFTRHDLRRTAATNMAMLRVPRLTIKKILNHIERDVTAIYDRHSYDSEKQEALHSWADKLTIIVSEPPYCADSQFCSALPNSPENPGMLLN